MPISWAGDCYDKRTVLLGGLALAVAVYAAFPLVGFAVTLVRTWVPIFAGVAAFLGILTVNHGRRALSAW